MEKTAVIWLLCGMICVTYSQQVIPGEYNGLCFNMFLNTMEKLKLLKNCTVVIGDLKILRLERAKTEDFVNLTFPKLKEVTGYMVVFRVSGLQTLGTLLPNLSRIRGNTLLYNYALIVYDVMHLAEVGLYSLLKIDRGGVIIWGGPLTCNVNTIDWTAIAPRSRHVLSKPDKHANCNFPCTCSANSSTNFCWNNKKCQIFLEGPDSIKCDNRCFGCRKTNSNNCTLCRDYTYKEECVSTCPNNTFALLASNHCVTRDECFNLKHWTFNETCVSKCSLNFKEYKNSENVTSCVPCHNCHQICGNITIQSLDTIQLAEKCVFINGTLTIHIWSIPYVANELRYFLKNIVEVTDYIIVYGSVSLTSLDFLSSLQRIKGRKLFNGKYSLVIYDMHNLQSLFTSNVTRNLKVDRGTLRFYKNPMLCMHYIKRLKQKFPLAPNELDIPQGMNGYSGSCIEVSLNLSIHVKNETFAVASFHPLSNDVHYTVLYVRIPPGKNTSIVPETCSDSEWFAINVPDIAKGIVRVPLPSLRPASMYAVCIEKYDPLSRQIARSSIIKFKTYVGIPEPPFILELVTNSSNQIVIKWVDHVDYKPYIKRYELDVHLVDISDEYNIVRDHCGVKDDEWYDPDVTRQAKVMRPPENYEKGCESMCGALSSAPIGIMVEDYFDICDTIGDCKEILDRPRNITIAGVLKSVSFDIQKGTNMYCVEGLAPFRDYKFSLKACTKEFCSRSNRGIVQTKHLKTADIATTTDVNIIEPGHIHVQWAPPKITNGPMLAYTVEIYPDIKVNDFNHVVPQTKCVPGNETSLMVKSTKAKTYLVRVCSTTLAHAYLCNEWKKIEEIPLYEITWWWSGVFFGLFLSVFSWVLGWLFKPKEVKSDTIPLCDATSAYRQESEPPAAQLSDFVIPYNISLFD